MNPDSESEPPVKKRKILLPRLQAIPYLLCDICNEKVYNYGICQKYIYCSYDCFSFLLLNDIINTEHTKFNDS